MGMNDRTWEDDVAAPLGSPSHLHALPSVPLPNPCSQARPASSLNLEKPEKEVRAGDAGRAALETHSPLLFLFGLKGAGELAGGRRRDHLGPVPAPCSPPSLSFPPPQLLGWWEEDAGVGAHSRQLGLGCHPLRPVWKGGYPSFNSLITASLCLQFRLCSLLRFFFLDFASHFWDDRVGWVV